MGHLTTALKEHEWTAAEDDALLRAHEALGNKWTAIAKTVGGRTDNGAKNRFKALMQKMNASKRGKKRGTSTTSPSAGAGTPTRGRRRGGTRTRESVEEGAQDEEDDGDGRRGKRRVASATRGRRGGAAKRAKPAPASPPSPSKTRASLDELAARQNGANGISPTLFVSSPTNSVSAFDRTAAWRPALTVNASSREHSAAGASGYGVAYEDGHSESGVSGDRVRTAKKAAKKAATPARVKKELPAVGDRVALALDDEDGVVTKVAGGWISVKLDDGTVEKFRSTELRY